LSQYRKGYRREKQVREHFETEYKCECVESRGSHGVADLICGNGYAVYVIQVKDPKKARYVNIEELRQFAKKFKGIPVLAVCYPYKGITITWL